MDAYGTEGRKAGLGGGRNCGHADLTKLQFTPLGALPLKLPEGAHESKAQTP